MCVCVCVCVCVFKEIYRHTFVHLYLEGRKLCHFRHGKSFIKLSLPCHRKLSRKCKLQHHTHSVQLPSHVQLSATPWTAACQASLSITNSRSLLKLMSIELVMPSNYLILCHPLLPLPSIFFPASESFPMSQFFAAGGQSIRVSASTSVLPKNIQAWLPLGWTGLISLQSKGLSRVFSNTTVQKHQFFGAQLSL